MRNQPDCCICGQPCEPWIPGHPGWGHNPDPLCGAHDRCCTNCNTIYVIPARLARMGYAAAAPQPAPTHAVTTEIDKQEKGNDHAV